MSNEQHWGFFPRFNRDGAAGDEAAIDACERGATFRIDSERDGALEVDFKGSHAIVPSDGLWRRPTPPFAWGEPVYVASKDMHAQIEDICWHFNEERYYFYLTCEGKPVKKRYYADELEAEG